MVLPATYQFRLEIQPEKSSKAFPTAPVPGSFLQEIRDQAIFMSQRRGLTGSDASNPQVWVHPTFAAGNQGLVSGLKVGVEEQETLEFGIDLFAQAAQGEALRLVKQGVLAKDAKFQFRVFAEARAEEKTGANLNGVVAHVSRKPMPLVEGSLAAWITAAKPVGPIEDRHYPLFILEKALDLAQRYSSKALRKDGTASKEAGALLLGRLFRQHQPFSEIFGVIEDAIEAKYADQEMFSLDLTAKTFAHLERQMKMRRTRLGRVDELPLGFGHAHNFLPSVLDDGKAQCPTCPLQPTCNLSSSFYSVQDSEFHRAVFGGGQPYAVGLVWGYTPREESDLRVFCLDGNQARQRGYNLVAQAPST